MNPAASGVLDGVVGRASVGPNSASPAAAPSAANVASATSAATAGGIGRNDFAMGNAFGKSTGRLKPLIAGPPRHGALSSQRCFSPPGSNLASVAELLPTADRARRSFEFGTALG